MPCHSQGNMLEPGVTFEYDICSGGGWGDPIERSIELVEADVRHGQISEDDAARVYGVVIGDVARTEQLRQQILASRLERAEPALKPLQADAIPASAWEGASGQLHVGVEQRGSVAVSERSGALWRLVRPTGPMAVRAWSSRVVQRAITSSSAIWTRSPDMHWRSMSWLRASKGPSRPSRGGGPMPPKSLREKKP